MTLPDVTKEITLEENNFHSNESSDDPVTVDDSCAKLVKAVKSIKINASWKDQGWGNKKARILLCLKRDERLICTHDVFGVYKRGESQNEISIGPG